MIINKTNKKIIAEKHRLCEKLLSKTIGLMFHKEKIVPLVFVFKKEKIVPLHMFFVFFPIDVLFLDEDKKVVEIKKKFEPFTLYNPKNKAKYVIELPQGAVKNTNTKIGDKVSLIDN